MTAGVGNTARIEADADGTKRLYPKALCPDDVFGRLADCTSVKATIEEMDNAVAEAFR